MRYSPSGGIDTGNGALDVGDFTQLLTAAAPPAAASWEFLSADVPGSGRLAVRYFVDGQIGQCAYGISIDELLIGPPAPPCATYPQIPLPGQTVVWTAAGSPYNICTVTEIPVGATVEVQSGATVFVDPGADLVVRGTLAMRPGSRFDTPFDSVVDVHGTANFIGTAANPVLMTGGPSFHGPFSRDKTEVKPGGVMTLVNVDLQTTVGAIGTGMVVAQRVAASGTRSGFFLDGVHASTGGNLRITDCTFTSGAVLDNHGGYVWIDDVEFDDGQFIAFRAWGGQTMLLDGIEARGRAMDSVFRLAGGDFHLGANNLIENNRYPVTLVGGGLARGCVVPTTGNAINRAYVEIPGAEGNVRWARLAVPYLVEAVQGFHTTGQRIDIEPGAHVLMQPNANIRAVDGSLLNLEGLPDAPIVFEPAIVGQTWRSIAYSVGRTDVRLEHVTLRGAQTGLAMVDTVVRVESCLFEDNEIGLLAGNHSVAEVRGTRFFDNDIGIRTGLNSVVSGGLRMDGTVLPSWIEGNTVGLETLANPSTANDARGNYWGDPSGPAHATMNPAGQGDSATGSNVVTPFLTSPPPADLAPVVRLEQHSSLLDEGAKHILHWTAEDDGYITHFRVIYAPHGWNSPHTVLVDGLPSTARSAEIVVPQAPPASNFTSPSLIRVEAFDDAGQSGWDEINFTTPYLNGFFGGFQPDALAGIRQAGETFIVCGSYFGGLSPGASWEADIWFEGDEQQFPVGFGFDTCNFLERDLPAFSTDLARFVVRYTAGSQNKVTYSFSDYFTIRPHTLIGDAAPQVSLVSPMGGGSRPSDAVVPVVWTASDDEALRGFDLHGSYDGGRTWSTIAHGLDAAARSYDWKLPPSSGIADVRVRVVARDHRFQNTSSTSDAFALAPALVERSCATVANSTGLPAIMTAAGSASVQANALGLQAWRLPRQQTAMFLASRTTGLTVQAGGSQGNLCLDGSIGRFNGAGQIRNSGPMGRAGLTVDLTLVPQPAGRVAVVAGETWHFTVWFRDVASGISTSNFADVIRVTFVP